MDKEDALAEWRAGYPARLVLVVNAVMFVGEFTIGLIANSTALLADSLDMLGDAMVYGFSRTQFP
ncbi:MAG: cation transporter [Gammaproteobacteria bacterium]|nr:cation transporter [Gammaproteobacteria bacterium]